MPNTGNTQQQINYGAAANDGLGDPLRTAFIKTDENFDNIWLAGPVGSNVTITNNTIAVNDTNGNLVLQPNGIGIIQTRGSLQSFANNLHYLGTANLRYLGGYFGPVGLDVTGNITAGNISTGNFNAGALTATGLTVNGDAQITGNLRVQGDIIQVGNIVTDTLTIQLANTAANGAQANGAGVTVGAADDIAQLLYNSTGNVWTTNIGLTITGNITGDYILANGAFLTGLPDPYSNANVANYLPIYSGTLNGSILNITDGGANTWTIQGDTILAASGGQWLSDPSTLDDYVTSAANGYINLQSLYADGNIASELHLEHGTAHIRIADGPFVDWYFRNTGVLETPGHILPQANAVYSLGNVDLQWANLWVANNTIYLGGVPLGIGAGNVLTVGGEPVLTNDSNTSITTTGNITADNVTATGNVEAGYVYGDTTEANVFVGGTANISGNINFGNGSKIQTATNNINLQANVNGAVEIKSDGGDYTWAFDNYGWATLPEADAAYTPVANGSVLFAPTALTFKAGFANLTFDYTGNLTLPSEGNIVGTTPNNAGRLQWVGNSSGDGFGYTTLGLIPDDTLVGNDQYLIIDPTAPGHIHIRAGGQQDNSNADLFLGGEYTHFKVTAGANNQARIMANSWPWTFGADGTFTLPANAELNGSQINSVANSSGDGAGYTTLQLVPDVTVGTGTDQYLIIDPTAPGHIHIRAGGTQDASSAELFLGGENSYFKVASGANSEVQVTSNSNTWVFNTDGNLQVPGNINGDNNGPLVIDGASSGEGFISLPATSFGGEQIAIVNKFMAGNGIRLETNGGNLFFNDSADLSVTGNITANYFIGDGSQLTGLPAQYGDANVAAFLAAYGSNTISTTGNVTAGNFLGAGSNVDIVAGNYDWTFDNAGTLTLPGNTFAVNYANGAAVSLGGNYGDANVVTLLGAFGSNTIVTTGNITANNFIGNISLTGNVQGTSANVTLVAGSYSTVFDNTGTATFPGNIVGNTAGFAIGYRDIPQVSFTGDATLAATAAGKHYYSTLATANTLTIANNTSVSWSVGTAITVVNRGTGNITVAQGSGVSLYLAGNSSAGNRTVTTYGMATLLNVAANVWMINGTGVV